MLIGSFLSTFLHAEVIDSDAVRPFADSVVFVLRADSQCLP